MNHLGVVTCLLLAAACGGDDGGGTPVDAGRDGAKPFDAKVQTFPAVCQKLPLSCPDAASLASCEAGSATAFGTCSYLPLTSGCASAACPSRAQICRTAESAAGHCTHSCVNNSDCVVAGGGSAVCQSINGVVKICVVN